MSPNKVLTLGLVVKGARKDLDELIDLVGSRPGLQVVYATYPNHMLFILEGRKPSERVGKGESRRY